MTLDLAEALLCCGELRREEIPPVAMALLDGGRLSREARTLRGLAASGARYAIALDYHRDLMPFYVADDEYDSPDIRLKAGVNQDLVRYPKSLLESEPAV
jgi:hypothetical protein